MITPLDEVAWVTNLRGNDIEFNPLFFSYAIIHKEDGVDTINLYTNPKKVENIHDYLAAKHIKVYPYEQIFSDVSKDGCFKDTKFVIDEAEMNTRLYNAMVSSNLINVADLVGELKMVKNKVQIQGFRSCQIRDGAALLKFIAWLRETIHVKEEHVTEYEGSCKLHEFRTQTGPEYIGDSFACILSTGANGAIIHYHPTKEESHALNPNEVILCDSGG